jgi:hypothetical protein
MNFIYDCESYWRDFNALYSESIKMKIEEENITFNVNHTEFTSLINEIKRIHTEVSKTRKVLDFYLISGEKSIHNILQSDEIFLQHQHEINCQFYFETSRT